jgi:hypothetical protein
MKKAALALIPAERVDPLNTLLSRSRDLRLHDQMHKSSINDKLFAS